MRCLAVEKSSLHRLACNLLQHLRDFEKDPR
jgi:hypothetical protein